MKMIQPITEANFSLFGTNVAENDAPAWQVGTPYTMGETVIGGHRVYEALAPNTGIDPLLPTSFDTWLDTGATNRWKAFNGRISDPVVSQNRIFYQIISDLPITGMALLNFSASKVTVQVHDNVGSSLIFQQDFFTVDDSEIIDWYTFFTTDLSDEFAGEFLLTDIPAYPGYRFTVIVGDQTSAGDRSLGQLVFGKVVSLGETLAGTSIGIKDYSTKDRDAFGNAYITQRAYADTTSFSFTIAVGDELRVKRQLSKYRSTAALYFAGEDIVKRGATTYGFFQDFEIPLSLAGVSFATLEIEGLT